MASRPFPRPRGRRIGVTPGDLWRIARIGGPACVSMLARPLSTFFLLKVVASFGAPAVAAFGIALRAYNINWIPHGGVAAAVATLAGQHLGAHQPADAERLVRRSAWAMAALGLVFWIGYPAHVLVLQAPVMGPPPPVLILLHHLKTGGTTLRTILGRQYSAEAVHAVPGRPAEPVQLKGLRRLGSAVRVVQGHIPFGGHAYLSRPAKYLTLLRRPVERIASLDQHVRELHAYGTALFEEALAAQAEDFGREVATLRAVNDALARHAAARRAQGVDPSLSLELRDEATGLPSTLLDAYIACVAHDRSLQWENARLRRNLSKLEKRLGL